MTDDKPTSIDIAYLAGVSQSTVSRALSGSPLVNIETRQKIEEIARRLNYKVDQSASRLRAKQTNTIALLLCEDPGWGESRINPFFLAILSSIAHSAAKLGFDLLLSFQQLSDDWAAEFEAAHRADGIILLGYGDHVTFCEKLEQLNAAGAHFVSWGARVEGQPECCLVGCDNISSGERMTRHLLYSGYKKIAFLGDITEQNPEFLQRYQGYSNALQTHKHKVNAKLQVNTADSSEQAGYQATETLLSRGANFDAIFAASDLIALGAIQALTDAGLSVPKDVAVVGFDDIPISAHTNPPLTTMRQNTYQAGQLLVDNLLKIIQGESAESVLIPTDLVVRKSCGANA